VDRGGVGVFTRLVPAALLALAAALLVAPLGGVAAQTSDAAVAAAFAAALARGDTPAVLALFADDAQIKERNAVLAAGRERVSAWARECLAADFALDPHSLAVADAAAAWDFADSTGCYWRLRPGAETAPRPGPEVNPAEGRLTIRIEQGRIVSLTLTYSEAWQAKFLRSVAAPIVAAQARATATAAAARQIATATAVVAAEATQVAQANVPHAPDTQGRTTPSVVPWIVGLGLMGLAALLAAASSRPAA
jgi:hypothetical protein